MAQTRTHPRNPLRITLTDASVPDELAEKIDVWTQLIQSCAAKETSAQAFASAVTLLKTFTTQRITAVEVYLAQ